MTTDTLHIPLTSAIGIAEANGWLYLPAEDDRPATLSRLGSVFEIDFDRPAATKVGIASVMGALLDRPVESISVHFVSGRGVGRRLGDAA